MDNLNLAVVKLGGNEKRHLLDALRELAEIDTNFNGENGEEYLWKEAKEYNESLEEGSKERFYNNMEYLLFQLRDLNDRELVEQYLAGWIERDHYWAAYEYEVVRNGDVIDAIALAITSWVYHKNNGFNLK